VGRETRFLVAAAVIASAVPASASETIVYGYDNLGRLVRVDRSGSVNSGKSAVYTYDATDNRTNVAVAAGGASPPAPSGTAFTIGNASAVEGDSLFFTVSRSGSTAAAASVFFSTGDGTALHTSDYGPVSDSANFAVGESSKTLSIATIQDSTPESTETFSLTLSYPSAGYTLAGTGVGTGSITDDDAAVSSYSVADAQANEGSSLFFKVTRTGATGAAGTVNYQTWDGPAPNGALGGADYYGGGSDITFAAGQTELYLSFATIADGSPEGPETVTLTISFPSGGGTITRGQATGTIISP